MENVSTEERLKKKEKGMPNRYWKDIWVLTNAFLVTC